MKGQRVEALVVSVLLAAPFAGCGREGTPDSVEGPRRARVRAFWEKLRAATEARLRPDCRSAVILYEEALAFDPLHEDALYYLGQCRRDLSEPRAARDAFQRLVDANPVSARGHLALGALLASPDPAEPMDLEEAEVHLRRAHEINGEETGPVVRLGEVLLATGRSGEAREWFEAALRTNPKSAEAAFLVGFVAWDGGSHEIPPLAERVREAAKVSAPVKGVLSEGDRKDLKSVLAPPLASPMGRLLFGAPIASLRSRVAAGHELGDAMVTDLWQETRRMKAEVATRSRTGRVNANQHPTTPELMRGRSEPTSHEGARP